MRAMYSGVRIGDWSRRSASAGAATHWRSAATSRARSSYSAISSGTCSRHSRQVGRGLTGGRVWVQPASWAGSAAGQGSSKTACPGRAAVAQRKGNKHRAVSRLQVVGHSIRVVLSQGPADVLLQPGRQLAAAACLHGAAGRGGGDRGRRPAGRRGEESRQLHSSGATGRSPQDQRARRAPAARRPVAQAGCRCCRARVAHPPEGGRPTQHSQQQACAHCFPAHASTRAAAAAGQ